MDKERCKEVNKVDVRMEEDIGRGGKGRLGRTKDSLCTNSWKHRNDRNADG